MGVSAFVFKKAGAEMEHNTQIKVYYADTDAYGVVWHGHYLRWLERARCDFADAVGTPMKAVEEKNVVMPVVDISLKYKNSALLHDELIIETSFYELTKLKVSFLQKITEKNTRKPILEAVITCVTTDKSGKLYRRMPDEIYNLFKAAKE